MLIADMITLTASGMLDDRATLVAGNSDELFPTSRVLIYLNEGQRILARDGLVIEDSSTASVVEITLAENQQEYPLHKSILVVKAGRLSDTDIDLVHVGYNDTRLYPSVFTDAPDYWDVNFSYTNDPGRPSRFSTDMGTRVLRLNRPVDATSAGLKLKLRVIRLPITEMATSPDVQPEVPEEYHVDLCKFAAGSCLANTADIDAELRSLGRSWVKDFKDGAKDAKRDKLRQQQPHPRVRFGGWARGDSD